MGAPTSHAAIFHHIFLQPPMLFLRANAHQLGGGRQLRRQARHVHQGAGRREARQAWRPHHRLREGCRASGQGDYRDAARIILL